MNNLNYGKNVVYFLRDLSANEVDDITSGEFDVYGEDDQGREGCAVIDMTLLAADAVSMISALQEQVQKLEAQLAALAAQEPLMYTVTFEGEIEEIGGDAQSFDREKCQSYIEWLCDEDNQDGYAVMPLYTRAAPPAPEVYNIGDATMRYIFKPTGMTK